LQRGKQTGKWIRRQTASLPAQIAATIKGTYVCPACFNRLVKASTMAPPESGRSDYTLEAASEDIRVRREHRYCIKEPSPEPPPAATVLIEEDVEPKAKRVKQMIIDAVESSHYFTVMNYLNSIPAGHNALLKFLSSRVKKEVMYCE
jgi:hypothetical protein